MGEVPRLCVCGKNPKSLDLWTDSVAKWQLATAMCEEWLCLPSAPLVHLPPRALDHGYPLIRGGCAGLLSAMGVNSASVNSLCQSPSLPGCSTCGCPLPAEGRSSALNPGLFTDDGRWTDGTATAIVYHSVLFLAPTNRLEVPRDAPLDISSLWSPSVHRCSVAMALRTWLWDMMAGRRGVE